MNTHTTLELQRLLRSAGNYQFNWISHMDSLQQLWDLTNQVVIMSNE